MCVAPYLRPSLTLSRYVRVPSLSGRRQWVCGIASGGHCGFRLNASQALSTYVQEPRPAPPAPTPPLQRGSHIGVCRSSLAHHQTGPYGWRASPPPSPPPPAHTHTRTHTTHHTPHTTPHTPPPTHPANRRSRQPVKGSARKYIPHKYRETWAVSACELTLLVLGETHPDRSRRAEQSFAP